MEDVQEMLAKAKHYRELAGRVTDQRARNALIELAEEYQRRAQAKQEGGDE